MNYLDTSVTPWSRQSFGRTCHSRCLQFLDIYRGVPLWSLLSERTNEAKHRIEIYWSRNPYSNWDFLRAQHTKLDSILLLFTQITYVTEEDFGFGTHWWHLSDYFVYYGLYSLRYLRIAFLKNHLKYVINLILSTHPTFSGHLRPAWIPNFHDISRTY